MGACSRALSSDFSLFTLLSSLEFFLPVFLFYFRVEREVAVQLKHLCRPPPSPPFEVLPFHSFASLFVKVCLYFAFVRRDTNRSLSLSTAFFAWWEEGDHFFPAFSRCFLSVAACGNRSNWRKRGRENLSAIGERKTNGKRSDQYIRGTKEEAERRHLYVFVTSSFWEYSSFSLLRREKWKEPWCIF